MNTSLGQSGPSGTSNPSSLRTTWQTAVNIQGVPCPAGMGVCGSRLGGTSTSIGLGGAQLSNGGCNTNTVGSSSMLGSIDCTAGSGGIPMVNNMQHNEFVINSL